MEHYELIQEYIEKMNDIQTEDIEQDHIEADSLLCDLLNKLGFSEVVDRYKLIEKWYA